jgi:cell division protein FtsW
MQVGESGKPDSLLLFSVLALIVFGLVMIFSAGIMYAQTRFEGPYYFFQHQLVNGILPGLVAFYFLQKINYRFWKKIAIPLFFLALILMVLVFIPGVGIKSYGASRWIQLGSNSFQPSEMMKLAIVIYLASWLASKGRRNIQDFFEGLLPFLAVLSLVGFLIIKQPDIGTLGVIVAITLAMFFSAGARLSHLTGLIAAGLAGLVVLIKMEPYRFNRFLIFMNPQTDPKGIGYHINQALIAIGSGGLLGIGLGHSRQKFNYLPEPIGDSIFAIIGEELGFIGAVGLVSLFLLLAVRGYRISKRAPDDFGKFLGVGITSWIFFQALINIGAISGIIPLTGVPLPFISYGGTSLVFILAGTGILVNISKQATIE